ncbi:hypothetical protein BVG19_g5137 [[Candida] boidinii]|nr:hypothetical protein BVG19_g5137 [[Candida] boidinii]OWB53442.1 hypothetical protein B5S27_g5038 [[Candida] boidinii]
MSAWKNIRTGLDRKDSPIGITDSLPALGDISTASQQKKNTPILSSASLIGSSTKYPTPPGLLSTQTPSTQDLINKNKSASTISASASALASSAVAAESATVGKTVSKEEESTTITSEAEKTSETSESRKNTEGQEAKTNITNDEIANGDKTNENEVSLSTKTVSTNTLEELRIKEKEFEAKIFESETEENAIDRFGLQGLNGLLSNENTDQTTIAIGIDLNMAGLDISPNNEGTKITRTFASPWLETSRSEVEPIFKTPDSFKIDNKELNNVENRLSGFNSETLFFIFYAKPKDVLQELAARELNKRNWRYHKDLQVWLTKDSNSEPIPNGPGSERGTYVFFDPASWEYITKDFVLYYQSII